MPRRPIPQRWLTSRGHHFLYYFQIHTAYMVLAQISLSYSIQRGRSPTCYSPVRHSTHPKTFSCDLHVLSVPPAFVLSQDQTLRAKNYKNRKTCFWFFTVRNLVPLQSKDWRLTLFFTEIKNKLVTSNLSCKIPLTKYHYLVQKNFWDLSHLVAALKVSFRGQNLNFI